MIYFRREDSEITRAIALSLAERDKSSNKSSKKNRSTDSQESVPTSAVPVVDPPPGLKKKRSSNPTESQDSSSLAVASNPPPGFKKKQSNYESDFPVMVKPPESLPSGPSLPYGSLIETNDINSKSFPTLCDNPVVDSKKVAPPPGFGKKTPSSSVVKPAPAKKEPFVIKLKHLLGNDEKFEQFKLWSSKYRMNEINAEDYESSCYRLFGDQQWSDIFDELVATFPDKHGQDNLIKAHLNRGTKMTKKARPKKHHSYKPLTAWGPGNSMGVNHMDEDLYPPLSGAALVRPSPAKWGHKVAVK